MKGEVYAKTDKGRDEIATRQHRLPARLRTVLLMIDGQRSFEALASDLGLADLTADNLAILLQGGFIALAPPRVEAPVAAKAARVPPPPARPVPAASAPAPAREPAREPAPNASLHDIYGSRSRY